MEREYHLDQRFRRADEDIGPYKWLSHDTSGGFGTRPYEAELCSRFYLSIVGPAAFGGPFSCRENMPIPNGMTHHL